MSLQLQQIRKKLYLHRNGASAFSMKEKGMPYKANWGVPVLTLRQLAKEYAPNNDLSAELWENDHRELKIMATMLYDPADFTLADQWVEAIDNVELAEQCVFNLFGKLPTAGNYAQKWIKSEKRYTCLTGLLLYTRLFIQGYRMTESEEKSFFAAVITCLDKDSLLLKNATLNVLRHWGRQSEEQFKALLKNIKDSPYIDAPIKERLYDDLLSDFHFLA